MAETPLPTDAAVAVHRFAELVAAQQDSEAATAMLEWVANDPARARYFAVVATTLAACRIRTRGRSEPSAFFVLRPSDKPLQVGEQHRVAMGQIVVRMANGEPDFAHDLMAAHHTTYGAHGLFWLGVCAVSLLASLITPSTRGLAS